ncbi:unnamed protein product [Durusdinium trenchii]|uniref:FIST C-domain domain-containing protein n=1 Tax=Durusdinium trenchii TaxID=1381693 RepID=A0ABP0J3X2_9DINO
MPFLCDYLGVDSLLDALSYMNAATLARVACTSRMGAVAAHEAQQRPSLLVLKGSLETIAQELKERLVARPTVVFVQYSVGHHDDEDAFEAEMTDFLAKKLPPTTQVLGGSTMSLQCAWFPENHPRPAQTTLDIRNRYDRCEVAILATTLPEASAKAFHLMPMQSKSKADSDDEDTYSEDEVSSCDAEEVEEDGLKEAEGASLAPKGKTQEAAEDPLKELLSLEPPPKVVVVYDADRGSSTARSIAKIQEAYPEAAVIGGVVMGHRILVRGRTSEGSISGGRGVGALAISGNVPLYAMTCPFTGCVATAKQTVANCMSHAQESATAKNESILGALLFTCNARGPHMFGCHAKDAALFQAQFPRAPLMGFYAAGEIGPQVEEEAEHAFLRGNAALQGFTAVFGMFLVPSKQMPSVPFQRAVLHGEVQQAFADTRQ